MLIIFFFFLHENTLWYSLEVPQYYNICFCGEIRKNIYMDIPLIGSYGKMYIWICIWSLIMKYFPSADSRRAIVSFWQRNVHLSVSGKGMCTSTGLPLRGLNLPRLDELAGSTWPSVHWVVQTNQLVYMYQGSRKCWFYSLKLIFEELDQISLQKSIKSLFHKFIFSVTGL